jgi:predicted O-methyltransferase YrrM
LNNLIHRIFATLRFYFSAKTAYQLHSPFVFDLANAVIEDKRYFYAFRDIEVLREKMLSNHTKIEFQDFGAGSKRGLSEEVPNPNNIQVRTVASITSNSGSSRVQSQRLFRLAHHLQPQKMLELGTSLGIGSMYLASAVGDAQFITLEGSPKCADVARVNLNILNIKNAKVFTGAFDKSLLPALQELNSLDFVFLDGNHRLTPTLEYFETCLKFSHDKTVFVLDDIFWSKEMTTAWEMLKNHPKVTLSVAFSDISMIFINPDFKVKQHFEVVPKWQKPWKIY